MELEPEPEPEAPVALAARSQQRLHSEPGLGGAAAADLRTSPGGIDPGRAGYSVLRVELSISCAGLPMLKRGTLNFDEGALIPIFAVLFLWKKHDRRWQEHGRTEVVRDAAPTTNGHCRYGVGRDCLSLQQVCELRCSQVSRRRSL